MTSLFQHSLSLYRKLMQAARGEYRETREMVSYFGDYLRFRLGLIGATTADLRPERARAAREQLLDLPRFLPFFTVVFLPVPGITEGYLALAVSLERYSGRRVSLLPSNFRSLFQNTPVNT